MNVLYAVIITKKITDAIVCQLTQVSQNDNNWQKTESGKISPTEVANKSP